MKMIYLAHPVSGDVAGNLARAKLWLKWLIESRAVSTCVVAPWITECEIWDDANPEDRAAGLARCKEMVWRCDELALVGGTISDGMAMEQMWAIEYGLTVTNLVAMGPLPPGVSYASGGALVDRGKA